MATDTTTDENSSDNHSTEEESNASMTRSTDSIKGNCKEDAAPEEKSEAPTNKKSADNTGSEKNTPSEFVLSEPIHIEVPHDDGVSEDAAVDNNPKSSVLDIHNIQILDDPSDKDDSLKTVEETISISDCSNSDKSSNDDEDTTKTSASKDSTIIINDDVSETSSINLKPGSVMVLNPKTNFGDKQILNNELLKGQRVFILNGNVISKDEAEKTKPDNINIICVSNNLNDLITGMKNDTLKTGCAVIPSEAIDKSSALKNVQQSGVVSKTANAPKFLQLAQSNYKPISPKINASTGTTTSAITVPKMIAPKPPAPSATKANEVLRSKLTDAEGMSINQNQNLEASSAKKSNSSGVTRKDTEPESPAVAKARSEFAKCRKKLIEAAIHPQLPTYKPPATYDGPIFTCEECDDTFSSTDSLKNHKNRRSVLFTYNCPPCNCTLEFYNRCTFLLHVRSHDTAVKACYLTISTIPWDKLNFKLLQPDEVEIPTVQSFERPIQRTRDRVIQRKSIEELHESTHRVEVVENGTDTPKTIQPTEQNNSRNSDLIKSLNKNKFEAYLKNIDLHKKSAQENSNDRKSDSDSTLSDDSTDDENDSNTSQDVTANDISSLNGSTNTSQLKYFLTTNDHTSTPIKLKRPTENGSQNTEETVIKKSKVNEQPIDVDSLPEPEPVLPKIKHRPIIIRTKTSPTKPESTVEKSTDEITLTSSDDEDDSEEENTAEEGKSVACRECKVDVVNLSKHIRAENKPLKEFLCEHCKFFSPSKCALQAHIRMHSKAQPYICPDCGFYFNTFDTFQTHVKQVCYYDFKAIRFECPECSLLKPSVQAFADHLKRCHTRDVFKCSLCITSSYSTKVVDIHIKKKHEGEEGAVLEGYRCMLCPNILISKKSIGTHINKHVFSLKHLRYVYICKRCKKYASGKRKKFVRHLNECDLKKKESIAVQQIENIVVKPKDPKEKVPKFTSTKSTNTKSNRNRPSKSPGKKEGCDIEKDTLSIESWEADKFKAQYATKMKICFMCRSADISSRSNSLFCNTCVCSVNADDTSESSEGVRHDSGRPKRKFKCRLCKQLMNKDWATITKHYETNHCSDFKVKGEAKPRQPKDKDKDKDKDKEKEKEPDSKKSDNVTPINIVKKRRLSTKDILPPKFQKTEEKSEPESEAELYSPGHSNSYECVHCNFKSEDHDEFKAHIIAHKDPNNTQCPECGQCFMVDASLAKHLLIVHHVRNLRRYFFENDLFKKDEPIERVKNLKDHQCDVCLMQCDSKQSYEKHLRTHGMAFVALQSRSKGEKPRCGLVRI